MRELIVRGKFSRPVDPEAVARDWRARGYSCQNFVDPPGRAWTGFVHETNELVTVAQGRLHLSIGAAELVAEPGDEILIPRGVQHSVRNIASGATRWLFGYEHPGHRKSHNET